MTSEIQNVFVSSGRLVTDCPFNKHSDADPVNSDAGMYAALKDSQIFQQVNVDLGALTWPNGADLDPSCVHEEISKNKTWSVPV